MTSTENCKYTALSVPPIVYSMETAKAVISPYDNPPTASYNFESPNPFLSKMSSPIHLTPHVNEKVAFVNMDNRPESSGKEFAAVPYDSEHGHLSNISGVDGESRFYAPKSKSTHSNPECREPVKSKAIQKDTDDYIFHFYIGSLTVVGLLILFRVIQKA
jgi:hypothetical protein